MIRGHLLVIPTGRSLVYVEPIYLGLGVANAYFLDAKRHGVAPAVQFSSRRLGQLAAASVTSHPIPDSTRSAARRMRCSPASSSFRMRAASCLAPDICCAS